MRGQLLTGRMRGQLLKGIGCGIGNEGAAIHRIGQWGGGAATEGYRMWDRE